MKLTKSRSWAANCSCTAAMKSTAMPSSLSILVVMTYGALLRSATWRAKLSRSHGSWVHSGTKVPSAARSSTVARKSSEQRSSKITNQVNSAPRWARTLG